MQESTRTAAPMDLARSAAEAIRALNHATLHLDSYTWPADVDETVAELEQMAYRLDQALAQAARWIARAHAQGQVRDDRGIDAGTCVAYTVDALSMGASSARVLAIDLAGVRQHSSHLGAVD